ncbi:hypothetical protein BH20ACT23_BH20ACT23_16650 [soil metagenome]
MKGKPQYLVLALAAVLAIGGLAHAGNTSGKGGTTTLRLLDVSDKFEFVDVGAAGSPGNPGPGDSFIFNNLVRNRADTKTLGTWISICSMTAEPGVARCSGTVDLDDGDIEVATTVDFSDADLIRAAVTGGTKDYLAVGGQLVLGEESGAGRLMTIKLVR